MVQGVSTIKLVSSFLYLRSMLLPNILSITLFRAGWTFPAGPLMDVKPIGIEKKKARE